MEDMKLILFRIPALHRETYPDASLCLPLAQTLVEPLRSVLDQQCFVLSAFVISLPYTLYQVWAFIAPGLYQHEKRFAA